MNKLFFSTLISMVVLDCLAVFPKVDPTTVWNREELYKVPQVWKWQSPFKGEAMPIWIEGVPYKGEKTKCFAFYGIPEGASKDKKVPGIVLVHGGDGTAYPEWVRLWVRRGYAAIAVDNCGQLPIYEDKKWMRNPKGGPKGWGRVDLADEPIAEQWPYHAVAVTMKAHSFLRSLDCVDTTNIGVTGISWGGFLTCILAAADDRFTYAVPVYGCGFNYERGGLTWSNPKVEKWSRMWDPSVFLPFAKVPMLWVDGTNDFAFSLDRVKRSADLAGGKSAFCTRLRMVHGHGPVGEAPAEILAFADHYARNGKDVVRFSDTIVEEGALKTSFVANGRNLVAAELLWTCDGEDVKWSERKWEAKKITDFAADSGKVSVVLPSETYQAIINLIDDAGMVYSTPLVITEK